MLKQSNLMLLMASVTRQLIAWINSAERRLTCVLAGAGATVLLIAAIGLGGLLGHFSPSMGARMAGWVDHTVLLLVGLSIFEISFANLRNGLQNPRFLALAWIMNFVVVPTIGFAVASLFLSGQPLFYTGLIIYFMAPCTDWFLGFTRLAEGDTALGAVLLPINMITQLLLYPLYLYLFANSVTAVAGVTILSTLVNWVFVPFATALTLRLALAYILPAPAFDVLLRWTGIIIPFLICLLIIEVIAANTGIIIQHLSVAGLMLCAIFTFFVIVFIACITVSRAMALPYRQHALLTMTTASRNAPLMLGITAVALPNQPLIYAAIVVGMVVELPHLTVLRHLLLRIRSVASDPSGKDCVEN